MLETREWVIVILTAVVVTGVAVAVGYLLNLTWLASGAWLLGIATAGLIMYSMHRSDKS